MTEVADTHILKTLYDLNLDCKSIIKCIMPNHSPMLQCFLTDPLQRRFTGQIIPLCSVSSDMCTVLFSC